jgi:hypothetical protein
MSDNDYYSKYLKYKMKYLQKKMQVGGDKEIKIHIKGMPPFNYELDIKDNLFFRDIQNFVLRKKFIPLDKQRIYYTKRGSLLDKNELEGRLAAVGFQSNDPIPHFIVNSPEHVIAQRDISNFIEIDIGETFGTLKQKISSIIEVSVDKIQIECPRYNAAAVITEPKHKVKDESRLNEYNISSGMIIDYVILP